MDFLKLKNYKINNIKNTIIDKFDNINHISNTLYYCYKNKIPCLVTDKSVTNTNVKPGINIVYNKHINIISWDIFFLYNRFLCKKYTINNEFKIGNNIFNIFFIRLIDHYYNLISSGSSIDLVGTNKAIFGIYNTFQDNIFECTHLLYYSFNLSTFILYKVYNTTNYIVGKLPSFIKYDDNHIIIDNKKYKCPDSFICINKNIFLPGIRLFLF